MQYRIIGSGAYPMVEINMHAGEDLRIQPGAMAYHSDGIELSAGLNSGKGGLGGLLSAVARSVVSNESMLITHAIADDNGILGLTPNAPGAIQELTLGPDEQYYINDGAFFAMDRTVDYTITRQKLSNTFFGNTGGWLIMETRGVGSMLITAFGDLIKIPIRSDNGPFTIDNSNVVAWSTSLDYRPRINKFGQRFLTGEGITLDFVGDGYVYLQTRTIADLANQIIPFIPTSNNS